MRITLPQLSIADPGPYRPHRQCCSLLTAPYHYVQACQVIFTYYISWSWGCI